MTTFLLIRHGQSHANLGEYFAGHTNAPLSALGLEQAELNAEYVASHYKVDAIYASDLARAYSTAEPLASRLRLDIVPTKQLREISAGEWEAKPFSELNGNPSEAWRIWREDIGRAVCPGGESVEELQKRILTILRRIGAENPDKTIAIATHATPIRVTQCHAMGMPLADLKKLDWVPNASLTVITLDRGKFSLVEAGIDGHLGKFKTNLPSNV